MMAPPQQQLLLFSVAVALVAVAAIVVTTVVMPQPGELAAALEARVSTVAQLWSAPDSSKTPSVVKATATALAGIDSTLQLLGSQLCQLDESSLMREAESATGLTDWGLGEDHMRASRRALFQTLAHNETALSPLGCVLLKSHLSRAMQNRLMLTNLLASHSHSGMAREVVKPVIIVGLPHSGTSHLAQLLSAHRHLAALAPHEALAPAGLVGRPPLTRDARDAALGGAAQAAVDAYAHGGASPRDPRHSKNLGLLEALHPSVSLQPVWPEPYAADAAWLLGNSFSIAPWHSAFNLSTHEVHISRVDMLAEFMFMERQLQVLQWQRRQRGDQRWLLHSPAFIGAVHDLLTLFPDSTLVWVHRDPVEQLVLACEARASVLSWTQGRPLDPYSIGDAAVALQWTANTTVRGVKEWLANDDEQATRLREIQLSKVLEDPVREVCALAEALSLPPCTEEAKARIRERHVELWPGSTNSTPAKLEHNVISRRAMIDRLATFTRYADNFR